MSHKIDLKLGEIITTPQKRDAIHIAVAPVIAAHKLNPGEHIGINSHRRATARLKTKVGVVDPFLKGPVNAGQQFWVFLFPNTITSMNHQWEHPAFSDDGLDVMYDLSDDSSVDDDAEAYIENFARDCGLSYEEVMAAANDYADYDNYLVQGGRFEGMSVPSDFWKHFKKLTGKDSSGTFFSCSC